MRDQQIAKASVWWPIVEVISGGLLVAASWPFDVGGGVLTWVAIGVALLSIFFAARSLRMEVRLLDSHLRVVNLWRTVDVPLNDIEGLMPDKSLRGALSLRVRGATKPVPIQMSPRYGNRREELRYKLQQALRGEEL